MHVSLPSNLDVLDPKPSEIINRRLYLGNVNHAQSVIHGNNPRKITHVLNVCEEIVLEPGEAGSGVVVEWVPIQDDGSDDIFGPVHTEVECSAAAATNAVAPKRQGAWWSCRAFLQGALRNRRSRVLVHCALGVNRSATIVIAWLMETKQLSFDEALTFVHDKRPFVDPVFSHRLQLEKFQVRHLKKPLSMVQPSDCIDFETQSATSAAESSTERPVGFRRSKRASSGNSFQEAAMCSVCGVGLGKRMLMPRHHCRICGASVCANCSPSRVQLDIEGETLLQRACTPCVANAATAVMLKDRLGRVAAALQEIGGSPASFDKAPENLQDAVRRCEALLSDMEDVRDRYTCVKSQSEGKSLQIEELQVAERQLRSSLEDEQAARAQADSKLLELRQKLLAAEARANNAESRLEELQVSHRQLESSLREEQAQLQT